MKKQGGAVLMILIFLSLGFFIGQKCSAASSGEVIINEAAWMGSSADANAEWLELKNTGAAEIDLSGWILNAADGAPKIKLSGTIAPGGYFLLERTDDDSAPGAAADLIYAGALGNSGEIFELKDAAGNLIDKIDASGGWPGGDNAAKKTMERGIGGGWQTSAAPGGTPRAANGQASGNPLPGNGQASNPANTASQAGDRGAIYGDVLINEFASLPEDGQNEWIELYNHGGGKLSLEGWTIAGSSGKETPLTGGFNENNYYFFVAEKFKSALNNGGDEIILYSDKHNIIDRIAYGKYGQQPENNAPAPGKGQSAALKIDGQKKIFDKDGFVLTSVLTKGKTNIISAPLSSSEQTSQTELLSVEPKGVIGITEILPNPAGSDREGEFIELHNYSNEEADLSGWRIEVEGGRSFEFGKFLNLTKILPAQDYFALFRRDSNLILDNDGGTIRLFAPGETKPEQILQYGQAAEGLSFCDTAEINSRNPNASTKKFLANSLAVGQWVWNKAYTPGAPNQIKTDNHPPVADFSAPENISTGALINFDASDSFDEDGDLLSFEWDFGDGVKLKSETPAHTFLRPGNFKIKLTASDGWEISLTEKIVKVSGLSLFDGNQEYSADNFPIASSQELLAAGSSSGNSAGTKAVKSSAALFELAEDGGNAGASGLAESKMVKTIKSKQTASIVKTAFLPQVAGEKISSVAAPAPGFTINKYKLGAALKISGTVIVLPGVFGSQYFYLLPSGNSPAVKIYSYKKDFPKLALGDSIEVKGAAGGSEIDKYLNSKVAANIKIIGQGKILEPKKITSADFVEENLNKFAQIEGEITAKSGSLISVEDSEGKLEIYLKSGANIDTKEIKAGQKITATGLLSKSSNGLAIFPRGQFDLILASPSIENTLGLATGSPEWTMPERKNGHQSIFYFLLVIAFFAVFSAVVFWKRKK